MLQWFNSKKCSIVLLQNLKFWSLIQIASGNVSKAGRSYTSAPSSNVGPIQASQHIPRKGAVTDKSGGSKRETSVVERTSTYKPRKRELVWKESNGWCRLHYNTNLIACNVNGSVIVRVASKGFYADLVVDGLL